MTSHLSPLPASADAAVPVASGELPRSAQFTSHASGASLMVSDELRFDSRLAVIHEKKRWLAVADLHYGYELSFRARGALFPEWGRSQIEERLGSLISDYQPEILIFLGDLVHTKDAGELFFEWVEKLRLTVCEIILLRGNHDQGLTHPSLLDQWKCDEFIFHHGHRKVVTAPNHVILSGHLHPAVTISDNAGLRYSRPALCKTGEGWVIPAFSPWAKGGACTIANIERKWIALKSSILRI